MNRLCCSLCWWFWWLAIGAVAAAIRWDCWGSTIVVVLLRGAAGAVVGFHSFFLFRRLPLLRHALILRIRLAHGLVFARFLHCRKVAQLAKVAQPQVFRRLFDGCR